MNEHPILFSGEMVRAILDGRKTQTRRVIKPQPDNWHEYKRVVRVDKWFHIEADEPEPVMFTVTSPYREGMRLWVRETWALCSKHGGHYLYRADGDGFSTCHIVNPKTLTPEYKWQPSIFMPRLASRLTLEVVNVRVERVTDISEEDARAEGVEPNQLTTIQPYRTAFCGLWDTINEKRGFGWLDNPWVWVVEFRKR